MVKGSLATFSKPNHGFQLEWVVDRAFILDFSLTFHMLELYDIQYETKSELRELQRH